MATSSVGSGLFAAISFLAISVLVLGLLRYYVPLRSTPAYLLFPVFLALALPCYIILLVPIDLASASEAASGGITLPERTILVIWRITYWLTFLLTWFVLPFLGEYFDSGERDVRGRTLDSLRSNAQYILIYFGSAIAGLVYFIWQNGFHFESIKSLVMALAYAWGLILAIGLMGHGLVALPRRIFKNASVTGRLRNLHRLAPRIKDKFDEAIEELDEVEQTIGQLKQRKSGTSRDLQDWIDDLADIASTVDSRPSATAPIRPPSTVALPAVVTERYLASIARKLQRARHKKARFADEWNNLCEQAVHTQAILDATSSKKLSFGSERSGIHRWLGKLTFITPSMRYRLYASIIPILRVGIAGLLSIASVLIIWSEIVRSFASNISIMSLTVVYPPKAGGTVGLGGQIVAAMWLLYMDACTLYAITDVQVWGNRALVKRQTYAESACWYSLQVAKLTVPLSYNFITMLPNTLFQETSFFKFLGQLIILTPLGKGFSRFFPCFLLIPVLATLFNLYGKSKKIIGFGLLEDDSDDNPNGVGTGGWREGRALIDHEIQSRSEGGRIVGLAPRASADLESRAGSTSRVPASASLPAGRRQAAATTPLQDANRQFRAITNNQQEEEDDSPRHFYQDFSERVRNTFDTFDKPDWVRNIKTPKWMKNDQRDTNDGPASGIARWFGGRPEEGRLQL